MNAVEIVHREIASAAEQDRPLLHIRVTIDALQGTPATVPVTPERARNLALMDVEGRGVVADPGFYERHMELVVHPADWVDVLKVPGYELQIGDVTRYMGFTVVS